MSQGSENLHGYLCPTCIVQFPSSNLLSKHWEQFHCNADASARRRRMRSKPSLSQEKRDHNAHFDGRGPSRKVSLLVKPNLLVYFNSESRYSKYALQGPLVYSRHKGPGKVLVRSVIYHYWRQTLRSHARLWRHSILMFHVLLCL